MKQKILCVGIIGIFLLTSFITVSAVDVETVGKGSETLGYTIYSNDSTNIIKKIEFKTILPSDDETIGQASAGTINDAVDNYYLTFTNTGVGEWYYQDQESWDYWVGSDAAKSETPGIGETCMLETHVEGSSKKILRFVEAVWSADCVGFYYDGEFQFGIIGPPVYNNTWALWTVQIPGGSHTIGWGFTNQGGNGYGLLDYIQYRDLSYNNPPTQPEQPEPWKKIGWKGVEFGCSVRFPSDPDGDYIYLTTDWGDGTSTICSVVTELYGAFTSVKHKYTSPGTYEIKCKAVDDPNPFVDNDGLESAWSPSTTVKIFGLRSSDRIFLPNLFERFPNAFPILRALLGRK